MRKDGEERADWIFRRRSGLCSMARVVAAGLPAAISWALLGPESTPTVDFGKDFLTIEAGGRRDAKSSPLHKVMKVL